MPSSPKTSLETSLFWRGDRIALRCLDGAGEVAVGDCPGSLGRIPWEEGGFVVARRSAKAAFGRIPSSTMGTIFRVNGDIALIEGPSEIALASGEELVLVLGDFTLKVLLSPNEPIAVPLRRRSAGGAWASLAAVALAHSVVLGLSAQAAQAREADDDEGERTDDVRSLLVSAEERMLVRAPVREDGPGGLKGADVNQRAGDGRAGGGERAAGAAGSMGEIDSRSARQARFAVAAPSLNRRDPVRALSRDEALAEAAQFGMIGLVGKDAANVPSPDTPWARASEALGADALSARGAMFGDWQGSYQGYHGLELTGVGEGGGGKGEAIGLGTIGTIGHGLGKPGDGTGGGGSPQGSTFAWWGDRSGAYGMGRGSKGHGHGIPVRIKTWPRWGGGYGGMVSGRLPPEIVQRTTRQNFGRFRLCYENGLRKNPGLAGRVVVEFVIGRDGAVSSVADAGSTLPDKGVVQCIVRAFYGLSFPQPEGGIVTVNYPLMLSPSD